MHGLTDRAAGSLESAARAGPHPRTQCLGPRSLRYGLPVASPGHPHRRRATARGPGIIGRAAGLFAVTNIDDILVLALFFAQGAGNPGSTGRIVLGQYLGFAAILGVAVAAAFGATFLPGSAIPYLGLLPLALGLKAAWQAWKDHRDGDGGEASCTLCRYEAP
ncbi:cadmium resistance transporter [Streptomyces sp. NPDC054932]